MCTTRYYQTPRKKVWWVILVTPTQHRHRRRHSPKSLHRHPCHARPLHHHGHLPPSQSTYPTLPFDSAATHTFTGRSSNRPHTLPTQQRHFLSWQITAQYHAGLTQSMHPVVHQRDRTALFHQVFHGRCKWHGRTPRANDGELTKGGNKAEVPLGVVLDTPRRRTPPPPTIDSAVPVLDPGAGNIPLHASRI